MPRSSFTFSVFVSLMTLPRMMRRGRNPLIMSMRTLLNRGWSLFLTGAIFLARSNESAKAGETPRPGSDEAIRQSWNAWNAPFRPFRIIGNIYYVGAAGVSSFLITTPQGHILIDTGFEMTVPRI